MAFGFDSDAEGPAWLPWLQIGVSSLLAVLFMPSLALWLPRYLGY